LERKEVQERGRGRRELIRDGEGELMSESKRGQREKRIPHTKTIEGGFSAEGCVAKAICEKN
jgi:hypothetical protein